jgi:cbb3-type cytochrome oxidase subunit 1
VVRISLETSGRSPLRADVRVVAIPAVLALLACCITVLAGTLSALVYTPFEPTLRAVGLTLQGLRPLHETFAFGWAFLAGVTVVHAWMLESGGALRGAERARFWLQIALWSLAGGWTVVALLAGRYTGREYAGADLPATAALLVGWLCFAWNYLGRAGLSLRGKPVYQFMWFTSLWLYVFTTVESHAYLLDGLSREPLRDLAVQWKSNGVMVGAFNQLLYGALMWVSSRVRGNEDYARSRMAFALFGVGVLNTFANYGHHTYHLPQSAWIHGIAFGVSMLEIVILAKCLLDLAKALRAAPADPRHEASLRFSRSVTRWTFLMLALAMLLSLPSLNSIAHGTHVITAHAMGAMIGIDSMIAWAAFAWILLQCLDAGERSIRPQRVRRYALVFDLLLGAWLVVLVARGLAAGLARYAGPRAPDLSRLVDWFPALLAGLGGALALAILALSLEWLASFLRLAFSHPSACDGPPSSTPSVARERPSSPPVSSQVRELRRARR